MRRIDKSKGKILSTEYKKKVDKLDNAGEKHPGKSWEYYIDVVMNLLYCQEGVCAYTEMFLCRPELLKKEKWQNGRYNNNKISVDENGNLVQLESKSRKVGKFGSLDHFNPDLKTYKYWDWDNLFVVHSDINTWKQDEPVDYILKPDSPGYNPHKLLAYIEKIESSDNDRKTKIDDLNIFKNKLGYIIETHYFVAHPDRSEEERKRINKMIEVLGLNHDTVCYERETFLNIVREKEFVEERMKVDRFFTAYEMVKSAKKQEEVEE